MGERQHICTTYYCAATFRYYSRMPYTAVFAVGDSRNSTREPRRGTEGRETFPWRVLYMQVQQPATRLSLSRVLRLPLVLVHVPNKSVPYSKGNNVIITRHSDAFPGLSLPEVQRPGGLCVSGVLQGNLPIRHASRHMRLLHARIRDNPCLVRVSDVMCLREHAMFHGEMSSSHIKTLYFGSNE